MKNELSKILRVVYSRPVRRKNVPCSKNLSSAIRRLDEESEKTKQEALQYSNSEVLYQIVEKLNEH